MFLSDGYDNTRVVKFDKRDQILLWGQKGNPPNETRPGYIDFVAGVVVDPITRQVYVNDRANRRTQVFDENGKFLDEWSFGPVSSSFPRICQPIASLGCRSMTSKMLKYDFGGHFSIPGDPGADPPGPFGAVTRSAWIRRAIFTSLKFLMGERKNSSASRRESGFHCWAAGAWCTALMGRHKNGLMEAKPLPERLSLYSAEQAYNSTGGRLMKRTLPLLLILLTVGARPGSTQKTAAGSTDQQKLGRQVLMQSCAVCHLPSGPDAKTYGPSLNKSTIPEDNDTVRQTILDGTGACRVSNISCSPLRLTRSSRISEQFRRERGRPQQLRKRAMWTIERISL